MAFTVGAKHVALCGLAALLLTYAAFHDKFPYGDGVSVPGRKGLTDSQLTPVLGDDVVATEGVTVEATPKAVAEDAMPTEENVEFTQKASEEFHEEKAVREMEEIAPAPAPDGGDAASPPAPDGGDAAPAPAPDSGPPVTPDPTYKPNPFLQQIQQNNAESAKKEGAIQSCIAEDGCGTPN